MAHTGGMTELAPLLAAAAPPRAPMTVVTDMLGAVRHHLDMALAYLVLFDGPDVVLHALSCDNAAARLVPGDRFKAEGTFCGAILQGALPRLLPDAGADPRAQVLQPGAMGAVGAMIGVPLPRCDGAGPAMLCCLSHFPRPMLDEGDLAIVTSYAGLLADVLDRTSHHAAGGPDLRRRIGDVIADRDFQLLLQPIVALADDTVMGAEALCRFRPTPYRSPDTWFAEARTVGLDRRLDRVVIAKTLELLPELPQALKLAINVAPDTLINADLPRLIDGPFSDRIIFELTDHAGIGSLQAMLPEMKALRSLGAQIAVDDLGTDPNSLNAVLQIKPDIVKLDRDLIRGLHMDPVNQALTAGILHFSKAIGARVVAEGIERTEEAAALRAFGVDYGQGFLLGRPGGLTALHARTFGY
ncbi:EAL domain, c-di-GMP-specific phosphodiesterase class I (or its enzymatically inactive variant) [Loktanella atrilutea]|uniref:EAL domain, c-di-GMP-specific phosphodiesterase class I (Or its enzymatically inactive variant) n=1 Tax=Loktanella atrilutea TaxID=366533 RepID=A0A1M4TQ75_LOKAT|nr:EAL domain-containing protein [Loktanella atrilutea]SHE46660.1 EAL domain, c-di-GMP-specific phosphodiesterase class I (or its enzymatically inactive variant) [Loktanella atrilutea]